VTQASNTTNIQASTTQTPRGHASIPRKHATNRPHPPAFTLTELLAVTVVVFILITLVTVVSTSVISGSRAARDLAQLNSISQAIETFETDFGYIPPLIPRTDADGNVLEGVATPTVLAQTSGDTARDILIANRYMSEYSITVYLLGIGRFDTDAPQNDRGLNAGESGYRGHDGAAGPGIRNPGRSRCWKDPADLASNTLDHQVTSTGRVYGPYLDLGAVEQALAFDEERGLYTIADTWGTPIRYYAGWPTRDPDDPANPDRVSIERTPVELWNPELLDEYLQTVVAAGEPFTDIDTSVDPALVSADYALLAAGDNPDKVLDLQGDPIPPFGDRVRSEADGSTVTIELGNDGRLNFPPASTNALPQVRRFLESNVRVAR